MQWMIENLPLFLFFGVAAVFVFRMAKHGGFKAAMFGAKIEKTIGKVEGQSQSPVQYSLKVHTLAGGSLEKAVGLELVATSMGSYQMLPITLSTSETKRLVSLLEAAVGQ